MDNRQIIIAKWLQEISRLSEQENKEEALTKIKNLADDATDYINQHFNEMLYWPSYE